MTAALVVRHDQDWTGFAIIIAILLVLTGLAYLDALRADRRAQHRRHLVNDANAAEVDHEQCHRDDCDLILCYCRTEASCPGTEKPGCAHVELYCDDHRVSDCEGCLDDARHDAEARWGR